MTEAHLTPITSTRRPATIPGVVLEHQPGQTRLTVTGSVDREKTAQVLTAVQEALTARVRELVVDLTESWNGALLLPLLTRSRAAFSDQGGVQRLTGVALPEFLSTLLAAPIDEVFLIYDAVRAETGGDR